MSTCRFGKCDKGDLSLVDSRGKTKARGVAPEDVLGHNKVRRVVVRGSWIAPGLRYAYTVPTPLNELPIQAVILHDCSSRLEASKSTLPLNRAYC